MWVIVFVMVLLWFVGCLEMFELMMIVVMEVLG